MRIVPPSQKASSYRRALFGLTSTSATLFFAFCFCLAAGLVSHAQERPIDTAASKLTVRAFKSGLFSGFADNHEIEAPIVEGTIDESAARVNFSVNSKQMKVLDPGMKPSRRQEVQDRMLSPDVLDSERFPQIRFESSNVEQLAKDTFLVHGQLSLHGVTRPITVNVHSENGSYKGKCTLKQRDFGIEPINIAGGTVKVKDELQIEFDIRTAVPRKGSS